jgi:Sulfotransferase domain
VTLRVVGAGLGRTGTHSLQIALQQLLGAPCYHMIEVFGHPEHVPLWRRAVDEGTTDWDELFRGYAAAVDWPAAAFWPELAELHPDAVVLLSVRESAAAWWRSADSTIFEVGRRGPAPEMEEMSQMVLDLLTRRFTVDWRDEATATAAYERHNDQVRASVPAERLVEWRPADGWAPICAALGIPVPDAPFPHVNTTADFRAMARLDEQ